MTESANAKTNRHDPRQYARERARTLLTWLIGVDVGGTFTDFFAYDSRSREMRLFKIPSTPENPASAIAEGLVALCREFQISPADIERVNHGTTVATNALIQRKGGKVAVITTKGFRDLLEIGRQSRPHLYSFQIDHPAPLVPRHQRFEVEERITAGPRTICPINQRSLLAAVESVKSAGVDACAVCLLFSFLDDSHERAVGEALRVVQGLSVSLSSQVQPEFREYERFSTAVLNAYLQPVMHKYLTFLEDRLKIDAPNAHVGIYQSSGGLMSIDTARKFPIRTALSGPAAGAVGAIYMSRLSKVPNIITIDMGGTSADVALIRNYEAGLSFDCDVAGFPMRLPMLDIQTIGAGGGSIAWFDRDGLLKVGPSSAGADPGPACYKRGGANATVTDANLITGRLSSKGLIGGRMPLDIGASRKALKPLAERLGFNVERTALGIMDIVVANMVRAIRTISVEKGHDPRNYCLLPFGGAGPLHASEIARSLGISKILIPTAPGILCAQGLIASDMKDDFVRSVRTPLQADRIERISMLVTELMRDAEHWFKGENVAQEDRCIKLSFDMRYVGQNFELAVPISESRSGAAPTLIEAEKIRKRFLDIHSRFYGFCSETDPVELVNLRLTAIASVANLAPPKRHGRTTKKPMPFTHRLVWFNASHPIKTPIFDRSELKPGQTINGPAVIDQFDSTTVLYPKDRLVVDPALNLSIRLSA
jgi:N-methylhydantoinase A